MTRHRHSQPDRIARLAELCGILPGYTDIRGRWHVTSDATRRALLHAMGIDVATGGAIEAAIRGRDDAPWRRPLPRVQVSRGGEEGVDLVITVADAAAGADWWYAVELEAGDPVTGTLRPEALPLVERRNLHGTPLRRVRWHLPPLPWGYHRVRVGPAGQAGTEMRLIVVPECCYLPPALAEDRLWGPSLQLFALRSERDWGIGDFGDLRAAVEFFAESGAALVGLNPLHQLYPHEPEQASPYSPSSRLFWNVWYIDVEAIPGIEESEAVCRRLRDPEFRQRLAAARERDMIDYGEMAENKRRVLELAFEHFREQERRDPAYGAAFREFQACWGEVVYRQALYDALAEHFRGQDPAAWGWPVWPEGYDHPDAPAVAELAARKAERVEFYAWLQWLAERQLAEAGHRCLEMGLRAGLYLDLPLGADSGGAEVWAGGDLFTVGAALGAPPDDFNLRGQNWGLPPWIPERLVDRGYQPFIDLLRRNMHYAGVLRLDHVMSLMRLFWIPAGAAAEAGAYVRYPMEDLLGILALESQRNRCAVVGEDLGTVPDELRQALARLGVLSTRIFYFEKDRDGGFLTPEAMPRQALVSVSNHDLPTLRGFWLGEDIVLRHRLGQFADEAEREAQAAQRRADRVGLLCALRDQGLMPEGMADEPDALGDLPAELMVAIHRYVARAPAMIVCFQMEDALGVMTQMNVPGTWLEHANWRRKLPAPVERWPEDSRVAALLAMLREERGSGSEAAH